MKLRLKFQHCIVVGDAQSHTAVYAEKLYLVFGKSLSWSSSTKFWQSPPCRRCVCRVYQNERSRGKQELVSCTSRAITWRMTWPIVLQVLIDACWGLSYLSDGVNTQIDAVVKSNCLGRLTELLRTTTPEVSLLCGYKLLNFALVWWFVFLTPVNENCECRL